MIKTNKFLGLAIIFFAINACKDKDSSKFFVIKGETMGSSYELAYDSIIDLKQEIEFTLGVYNYLLSTYDSNSIISKFNNNKLLSDKDLISYRNSYPVFLELDSLSKKIYNESGGAFHPGLSELINYWGFGEKRKNPDEVDSNLIVSLRNRNSNFLISFDSITPKKQAIGQKLNFNAIAPGQAVDILAKLFDSVYHFKNYYINISGEIRVKGNNGTETYWPIKIEKPLYKSEQTVEYCRIELKNYSMATSGNYRQYYEYKGRRLGHSIDPRTGYPSENKLLSVSILAPSAAEADAYATACMVLGLEDSKQMIQKNLNLKALIIYEENGKLTHWKSSNLSIEMKAD